MVSLLIIGGGFGLTDGVGGGGLLDLGTKTWVWLDDPPQLGGPRFKPTVAYGAGRFFVWGGDAADSQQVYGASLDPASGQWECLPAAGAPASYLYGGWSGTGLFVPPFGGKRGGLYDPAQKRWTSIPARPSLDKVVAADGVLYAFGDDGTVAKFVSD